MKTSRSRTLRALVAVAVTCSIIATAATSGTASTPVAHAALPVATQIMNWFPEPEHGGFYTAAMQKLYQKHGLDLSIKPFSYAYTGFSTLKEVALGRTTFAMANADDVFAARAQGIPVVAIFATMQHDLQCFMWRASDTSIKTLADLSNHTIIYGFGASFWNYLTSKYHYTNITTKNYNFSLRDFLSIPNAVNQGYITEEPYTAEHTGHVKVKAALIGSAGYDPYYQVMVASEDEIKNHPDVVRAYVAATVEGWKNYFASMSTTEAVNAFMRNDPTAKSFPLTAAAMTYAAAAAKPLVSGDDARPHGIGYMSMARMTLLKKQLVSVGIKVANVDPASTFTDAFLPKM